MNTTSMLRCQEPLYRRASFINGALGALQTVSKLCLFAGVLWSSIYGIQCRPADMTLTGIVRLCPQFRITAPFIQ